MKEQLIHPLSYIHPNAKIGKNVRIDPFAVIQDDVEIGDNTWIASNVIIMSGARIGKNCKFFPGSVISAIPQDLKFGGENTTVEIGDNCTIREYVSINRGTTEKGKTKIGNNCMIMAYSHIAHDCIVGDNCVFSNNTTLAGHIEIGDYVVLAGWVGVQQFVRIGAHSFITAGNFVRKDVPPFVKAAREPLSYVGVNSVGLKRRGYDTAKINHLSDIYRTLFVKGYNISKAINIIEAEIPVSDERDEILKFVRESKKGIMKGFTSRNFSDD